MTMMRVERGMLDRAAGSTGAPPEALRWIAGACAGWSGPPFEIRLWNDQAWRSSAGPAAFTVTVGAPGVLVRLALGADLDVLGDLFVSGALDVDGDLLAAFDLARHVREHRPGFGEALALAAKMVAARGAWLARGTSGRRFRAAAQRGSVSRAREAVNFHYELPHAFFRLFLDERNVYSCAYFEAEDDTLEAAQLRKLDHVCRKLRLRPGDELLDLGCGWGALSLHAAAHYGARVTGITLSERQAEVARERAALAGLSERCRVEVRDFRHLEGAERFDKIASVGAIEHVPLSVQPAYFRRCFELLRPGGLMMNHGITMMPSRPLAGGNRFLQRYVFPEHEIVPVHETLGAAQHAGFEVRDVESLREHYGLTLAAWYRRLEAHADEAGAVAGDATVRAFRVYLAGMSRHFREGELDLHQSLLGKSDGGRSGLPLTRADLYWP